VLDVVKVLDTLGIATVRASRYAYTTIEEIDHLITALQTGRRGRL
jgi:selenocysteine lyase/cysteine desulfurase